MAPHDCCSVPPPHAPALARFVIVGLLATVESFRRHELPLHRLSAELQARTDTLAEVHPPSRARTRLRWLHREVARVVRASAGAELDPAERAHLDAAMRSVLTALLSPDPQDHTGAPHPGAGAAGAAV